ncbi:unnamed protein product, partial [marine sediment metagenome]
GVTVAVIDIGFGGYDEAEIPGVGEGSGRTISFIGGGGMGGSQHGTAVAEVVADMAPGAEIYLVAVDTNLAIEQAIAYVRDNDFDVAVMSLGIFEGPYDGTHSVSQKVNGARASGVFWVNAAGNHAQRHYEYECRLPGRPWPLHVGSGSAANAAVFNSPEAGLVGGRFGVFVDVQGARRPYDGTEFPHLAVEVADLVQVPVVRPGYVAAGPGPDTPVVGRVRSQPVSRIGDGEGGAHRCRAAAGAEVSAPPVEIAPA